MDADEIVKTAELLKGALLKVTATMAMANGDLDETGFEDIAEFCTRFTGDAIGAHQIAGLALAAGGGENSLSAYLESIKGEFPGETREVLIRAAIFAAKSDQELVKPEIELLNNIAKALGVPKARLQELISEKGAL
ncbi:MAG TPA: TerB family tellurite resistance protein [Rhodospirillales bacterium]|nr:TerB family tellurite resistance protein [Rhodospirillales bacterium]